MLGPELAGHLAAAGHGALGTSLFVDALPETPANAAAVLESGGAGPMVAGGRILFEQLRVQVLVRDASYEAGRARAWAIAETLDAITNTLVGAVWYHRVAIDGPPTLIYRDPQDRPVFSLNADVMKAPSSYGD